MEEKKIAELHKIADRHNIRGILEAFEKIQELEESLLSKDRDIEKMKAENESLHKYWMPTAKNEERLKDVYREENERLKGLIDKAFEAGALRQYSMNAYEDQEPDLKTWKQQNNL
jgi:hypothetical protein